VHAIVQADDTRSSSHEHALFRQNKSKVALQQRTLDSVSDAAVRRNSASQQCDVVVRCSIAACCSVLLPAAARTQNMAHRRRPYTHHPTRALPKPLKSQLYSGFLHFVFIFSIVLFSFVHITERALPKAFKSQLHSRCLFYFLFIVSTLQFTGGGLYAPPTERAVQKSSQKSAR